MSKYDDYEDYQRYKIVFPYMRMEDIKQISNIEYYYFYHLSLDQLKKLIELGFVKEYNKEYDENVVTLEEIVKLLEQYPKLKLCGYITSNKRDDATIFINAIKLCDKDALDSIMKLGLIADVMTESELNDLEQNNKLDTVLHWFITIP